MATINPRGYGAQRYRNDNATSTVQEDGVEISDVISTFNFAGDGVSSAVVDDVVTVTIPGTFTVQEEGITTSSTVRTLNFVGAGTASGAGATATITIPAATATMTVQEEGTTLSSTVTTFNWVGQDVVASGAGATTTITKGGLTSTVTSVTPVVLTAASSRIQVFTGSTAQTVTLPVVATAPASNGYNWEIHNDSTATMTIQTSGLNTLATLYTGQWGIATIVDTTGGTGTASWDFAYGTSGNPVLDSAAAPPYPVAGDTKGVWYGTNTKANSGGDTCVTIGPSAQTVGNFSNVAIGPGASATSTGGGVALGGTAVANGNGAPLAVGYGSSAAANDATALGYNANVSANGGTAVGRGAIVNASSGVAVGYDSNTNSIANAVVLSGNGGTSAQDAAHALAFGINTSSVNPGTLGLSVNNATYQVPMYRSMYNSTATAAGTTTLSVSSATLGAKMQRFSGSTTQTCVLPVVTTLANGFEFVIVNDSTGAVTVNSSGGNTVTTLAAASAGVNRGGWGRFVCVDTAGGTGVASWTYLAGATII